MPQLFVALLILWVLLYGIRIFARANPKVLAKGVKTGGGVLALGAAGLLLLRGRIDMAGVIGGVGLWLLGWANMPMLGRLGGLGGGFGRKAGDPSGRSSRVRSAMIEMELDHDSGSMQGTVLAGVHEGKALSLLTLPQCEDVHAQCLRDDPDGARLLEAYLDRRFPGWRPAGESNGDPGGGGGARNIVSAGAMSQDEAYEILGLQKGATREDVTRAHRTLMKKLHPDHGGTNGLAARVNEAKDVLLRRHT